MISSLQSLPFGLLLACSGQESETGSDPTTGTDDTGTDDTGTGVITDADADGFTDDEEAACGSNPADGASTCYACGWKRGDSTGFVASGSGIGDTIENLPLLDQCKEDVPLWDMAGMYHILFLTASW